MLFVRIVRCPFTRWMIHIHKIKTASSHIFKPSYLLFWWSDLHKIFRICFWDHFSGFENVSSTDALCKKHSSDQRIRCTQNWSLLPSAYVCLPRWVFIMCGRGTDSLCIRKPMHFNSFAVPLEVAWPILFAPKLRPLGFLLIPPGKTIHMQKPICQGGLGIVRGPQ